MNRMGSGRWEVQSITYIHYFNSILKQPMYLCILCWLCSCFWIDCVARDLHCLQLLQHGIDGKMYRSICSWYLTESFPVQTGVRKRGQFIPNLLVYSTKYNDIRQNEIFTADNFIKRPQWSRGDHTVFRAHDSTITIFATAKCFHNALTIRSRAS